MASAPFVPLTVGRGPTVTFTVSGHPGAYNYTAPPPPLFTVTANGDGTLTITGAGLTDNGDGSLTLAPPTGVTVTDNGDGTLTLAA